MDGFEVGPHCGCWVGEPAMGEGVRCKQIAEITGSKWKGNWKEGKNGDAQEKRTEADGCNRQSGLTRQAPESPLDAREPGVAQARPCKRRRNGNRRQTAFKQCQRKAVFRAGRQ